MTDDIFTKERLKTYIENFKYYARTSKAITNFQSRKYPSVSERRKLERLIREIKPLKSWLLAEQKLLKEHISKVKKPEYRKILKKRYLYLYNWQRIEYELFGSNPDFEILQFDKYKDKTMRWHREALEKLRSVNYEEMTAVHTLRKILRTCRNEPKVSNNEPLKIFIEKILALARKQNI